MLRIDVTVAYFSQDGQLRHINEEYTQLDHVREVGPYRCKGRFEVFKNLLRLCMKITLPDDLR